MIVDQLQVAYCEGWDSLSRQAVGPLSSALAQERDRAGEQYTVVLSSDERPMVIIDVARADRYWSIWVFDELLRRRWQAVLRGLEDDRVFVTEARWWVCRDDAQTEFDEMAFRRTFVITPDGRMRITDEPAGPRGGCRETTPEVDAEEYWRPYPVFGDWWSFADLLPDLGHEMAPDLALRDVSDPDGQGLPAEQRPWRPPRPLRPTPFDDVFRPGTRYRLEYRDAVVAIETKPAGVLRMPSGRLVAADPGWLEADAEPFTVAVAPGEYPVEISLLRFVDNPDHCRVAAARLTVREEPVADWELALRPDQNPRGLGEGEFFGFGVDAGMGCFFDAAAAKAMAALEEDTFENVFRDVLGEDTAELSDPASGANLIAFSSGWGDGAYPTWIGRTASGEVACFVADMLILGDSAPCD